MFIHIQIKFKLLSMKKLIYLILLLSSMCGMAKNKISTSSNTNSVKPAFYVNTIENLQAYTGIATAIIVTDPIQGGVFNLVNGSYKADRGTIFTALGLGANNYWQRSYNGTINANWFGAKGDGITDDTKAIQEAFNAGANKKVNIPDGKYMINAIIGLLPPSNTVIEFARSAQLNIIPNSSVNYSCINIKNVNNVKLINPTVIGDRTSHTGIKGEWGMGIFIGGNSKNIKIINPKTTNCWGDGIYIDGCSDIYIENMFSDNNRRQGMSVVSVDGLLVNGALVTNSNGTPPQSGIDLEPDYDTDILNNIHLLNIVTKNNTSGYGITINLNSFTTTNKNINITIENHKDYGSYNSIGINNVRPSGAILNGVITLKDTYSENALSDGIYITNYGAKNTPLLKIIKPVVINPNSKGETSPKYGSGISIVREIACPDANVMGNLIIDHPTISDNRTKPLMKNGIYAIDEKGIGFSNARINNPLKIKGVSPDQSIVCNTNGFAVRDSLHTVTLVSNSGYNFTIHLSAISTVTNTGAVAITPFTLHQTLDFDAPITFINSTTYGLRIIPTSGYNILPISTVPDKYIQTIQIGASITLKRLNSTSYIILSKKGDWIVEDNNDKH
jgi:hypothetical protein